MGIERRTVLLTINHYVKAKTLEEAYELNQARNARIMGGMMWMRLGNAKVQTIIDISGLGLDQIEETDHVFRIGVRTPQSRSTVPESGNRGWKHLWEIRLFRCADLPAGSGYIRRAV